VSHSDRPHSLLSQSLQAPCEAQNIEQDLLGSDDMHYGHSLFSLHPILVIHMVETFDIAVWSWKNVVRDLETTRPLEDAIPSSSFESIQKAARRVIHCSEALNTAISAIDEMKKETSLSSLAQSDPASVAITKDLSFCISLLKRYLSQSQALEDRLDNEVLSSDRLCKDDVSRLTSTI
jgi:hypothetical protein